MTILGDQYMSGTPRGERPVELIDAAGDMWQWSDADQQGTPGYRLMGGTSMPRRPDSIGPAYTYEYVTEGRWCYQWERGLCAMHDHVPAAGGGGDGEG